MNTRLLAQVLTSLMLVYFFLINHVRLSRFNNITRLATQWRSTAFGLIPGQCKEGLARIPKVRLHTPRDPSLSAGIICFEVEGQAVEETVRKLHDRKVIATTSPYKVSYVRLAPSLVNDESEVDAALRAVREATA